MRYRVEQFLKRLKGSLWRTPERTVLKNVFNTQHQRTALLSYIAEVFSDVNARHSTFHTNRYTTYLIAESLNELGYNVDVVGWDAGFEDDLEAYQVIIGLGKVLDRAIEKRRDRSQKIIWFGTGCNPMFSNVVTMQRITDFYRRTGKLLFGSSRYIQQDWPLQHELSDYILLHGSSFARNTYSHDRVSCLNGPVFIRPDVDFSGKDLAGAKRSFLWFGTGGLIHKGLDLVLETFSKRNDCRLHICGDLHREPDFYDHYRALMETATNISWHGFVDVQSDKFIDVLKQCSFVVFPSASEGNSPSVVTCMANGGLIPVATLNADVDADTWGIVIEDLTEKAVHAAVDKALGMTEGEIKQRSQQIIQHTGKYHSFEYFRKDFRDRLEAAVREK